MATVIIAAALAAVNELARGTKKSTKTNDVKAPAIMAPVSCPYCPRMPQPIPAAIAVHAIAPRTAMAPTFSPSIELLFIGKPSLIYRIIRVNESFVGQY
jgi:hypothetical protein